MSRPRTPRPRQPLPSERLAAAHSNKTGIWLIRGIPLGRSDVVWLKRPMPDGQWPPDRNRPRDDSFSWWVRSSCGHEGGVKQWAFYAEADADTYEHIFRADPCYYTRCQDQKRGRR